MPRYTNQTAFNRSANHLLKQNKKSMASGGERCGVGCMYRGPDDTMCAIGVLITNKEYHTKFEGSTVMSGKITELDSLKGLDFELLRDLQRTHDRSNPSNWRDNLMNVASNHGLSTRWMKDV